MGCPRAVEKQVGQQRSQSDLVPDEVMEHEHISLLDDLCSSDPAGSQQHVGGNRRLREVRNDERARA